MKHRVLVLDDDAEMRRLLCDFINEASFECIAVQGGEEALQKLRDEEFDLFITDLRLVGMSGFDVLQAAKNIRPDLAIMTITAFGSIGDAVQAIKLGAYHYITKPFKMAEISVLMRKAIAEGELRKQNVQLRQALSATYSFSNIIGRSPAMQQIFKMIQSLASNTSNVLVTGESGTGKELVAKAIHFNSPLKEGPFVAVNCSAIPEGLLESEMFGHVKGAFSGAVSTRRGLLEASESGSFFLDEIGDLPLSLQAKFLRVLQDQMVRPVGSDVGRKINTRIISATHRNLGEAIKKNEFREDLFYRLNVIPLQLPKLADRLEDIPLLVQHFIAKHADKSKVKVQGISKEALDLLFQHPWPGNIRELENVIERSMAFAKNETLDLKDIFMTNPTKRAEISYPSNNNSFTLERLETEYIKKVLQETHGQKDKAAKILGINRRTLYRKAERYGINLDANHYKQASESPTPEPESTEKKA